MRTLSSAHAFNHQVASEKPLFVWIHRSIPNIELAASWTRPCRSTFPLAGNGHSYISDERSEQLQEVSFSQASPASHHQKLGQLYHLTTLGQKAKMTGTEVSMALYAVKAQPCFQIKKDIKTLIDTMEPMVVATSKDMAKRE